jgi:hypothetical protein
MTAQLAERLQTITVDAPIGAEGFRVFGLRWSPGDPMQYLTLDEGLAQGLLEVSELSEGGSVPTLKVRNSAETFVFLMAGEQLIGAKQNRVLNASILVPAKTELPIPVSCVEAGRWAYRSRSFGSGGSSSHGKLRYMMHRQVTQSYTDSGTPSSVQEAVWDEVSRKLGAMGSVSPSAALDQVYQDQQTKLDNVFRDLHVPEGACGALFVVGGRIAGVDLFDRPETLQKLWPKLVRAYALDAFEVLETQHKTITPGEVKTWLGSSLAAKSQSFKSPGAGEDVRLEGTELIGAGLVVEDHPVHVELFPTVQA